MSTLKELLKQQEELAQKIEAARSSEVAEALAKVRTLVEEFDLTADQVFPPSRKSSKSKSGGKVAPKYRDPATGQTWTGRGKAPKWIEGKDRTPFAID